MNYLIAYDIQKNKLRKKLSTLLEKYGSRVNFSVFECTLSKTKLKQLLEEIKEQKLYDERFDSIRFYHICEHCVPKSFDMIQKNKEIFEQINLYFD